MFPVLSILPQLRQALSATPAKGVVLLQAAPGAGKSTVLPLHLLDEPWLKQGKIIMLQPRRLAARAVAHRLAEHLGEQPGMKVGFRIRHETCVSAHTRIEVVTEGVLARMIQADPALEGTGLLIFDEFHERNIHADTALALALQVQQVLRPDLRLLVMSATLPASSLLRPLGNPPVIETPVRNFPVEIIYDARMSDAPVWERMASAVAGALQKHEGDILGFLPGAREINRTKELLERTQHSVMVYPLYGDLPHEEQRQALLPDRHGRRKVVLATNIAETSLTIDGIRVVIDSGLARTAVFDARSGLTRLQTRRITHDAAAQRAGRAGRNAPGVCYRLWTLATHNQLQPEKKPEIEETDLAPVVLTALRWGARDVYELPWITPPPAGAVSQALDLLTSLEAVNENGLTQRGIQMSDIPAHPRLAHLLTFPFASPQQAALAADIAALLEERDILQNNLQTDFTLRVETLRKYRREKSRTMPVAVQRIIKQAERWRKWLNVDEDNEHPDESETGYLLLQAYPDRLAMQLSAGSNRYRLRTGRLVLLDNHDRLTANKWIVAAHADAGNTEGRLFLGAAVDEARLSNLATVQDTVRWDEKKEMITVRREYRIGTLLLKTEPAAEATPAQQTAVWLSVISEKGMPWLGWEAQHDQWCNRVLSLRAWRKDEPWPDVHPENLLNRLEEWLAPFLAGMKRKEDLKQLALADALNTLIPPELQPQLERLAPERITVPSGSRIKVFYKPDAGLPHMEVRLQECFGLMQTPTVNNGQTPVLLHLLSPGFKPVQVTQDLPGFWRNTYPVIRRELMRRYPRHAWPEDPVHAEPVRGAVKKSKSPQ
ncbi:MAG: ATP-dependent helicase HrpB [Cyclobacteriaceae bacterium]|nr:MAG: ATP-dependent helicase HrpB [Cyclobacteriaceae bacterium]